MSRPKFTEKFKQYKIYPHAVNTSTNFIAGWYSNNDDLFDSLISYYLNSDDKKPGNIFDTASDSIQIAKKTKESTDINLLDPVLSAQYYALLFRIIDEYTKLYPWSQRYQKSKILETPNIQHYRPGEGFHAWHTERSGSYNISIYRHLVFMTYLNTLSDGGETEWLHQKVKIKPQKGLTVIWPSDWTFTHRGITSHTQDKYIVTGWLSFIDLIGVSIGSS